MGWGKPPLAPFNRRVVCAGSAYDGINEVHLNLAGGNVFEHISDRREVGLWIFS